VLSTESAFQENAKHGFRDHVQPPSADRLVPQESGIQMRFQRRPNCI